MVQNTSEDTFAVPVEDNAALAEPPHNYAGGATPAATGRRMVVEETEWVDAQPPGTTTPSEVASSEPTPDGPPDKATPEGQLRPSPVPMELPDATDGEMPEWVKCPPGMKFPRGKQVIFLRFRAQLTDTPNKGERQAILWSNNLGDSKLAYIRADKDPNRLSEFLAKQMIRVIDGQRVSLSGELNSANLDIWWDEIGPKSRGIIDKLYMQLHFASRDESVDFFENCVAVRVATG